VEPDLALRFPPAVSGTPAGPRPAHGADQRSLAHRIHHLLKRLQAGSQAECPKALRNLASSLTALDGIALDVVSLLMALLLYGIGTRTYRLEASNAAPPISTTAGVYSEYCALRFAGMIGREQDAWDARLLGGTDACDP
jgi:hypothetical protein